MRHCCTHLAVAASSSAPLDAKGGPLAGLPHVGNRLLAQVSAQGLAQAHCSGAFALPQRRGRDASHHDCGKNRPCSVQQLVMGSDALELAWACWQTCRYMHRP